MFCFILYGVLWYGFGWVTKSKETVFVLTVLDIWVGFWHVEDLQKWNNNNNNHINENRHQVKSTLKIKQHGQFGSEIERDRNRVKKIAHTVCPKPEQSRTFPYLIVDLATYVTKAYIFSVRCSHSQTARNTYEFFMCQCATHDRQCIHGLSLGHIIWCMLLWYRSQKSNREKNHFSANWITLENYHCAREHENDKILLHIFIMLRI